MFLDLFLIAACYLCILRCDPLLKIGWGLDRRVCYVYWFLAYLYRLPFFAVSFVCFSVLFCSILFCSLLFCFSPLIFFLQFVLSFLFAFEDVKVQALPCHIAPASLACQASALDLEMGLILHRSPYMLIAALPQWSQATYGYRGLLIG